MTMEMMATVSAVVDGKVSGRRKRKPTARLVAQLERELAQAREDARFANARLSETSASLTRRTEVLTIALNERDEAREERDYSRRWARDDAAAYDRRESELRKDLRRIRDANADLCEKNRDNFDKAYRNGEVAAVLACLVAATNSPADAMLKFTQTAEQMGVSPEVLEVTQTALKRGYTAQVEQTITALAGGNSFQPNVVGDEKLNEILSAIEREAGFPLLDNENHFADN